MDLISQRQHVHIKPDLIFQIRMISPCDGGSDDNILLGSVAMKQYLDQRYDNHKKTGIVFLSYFLQLGLVAQIKADCLAVKSLNCGARIIGWQIQHGHFP